ncbi:hypothetical protein B0H11DRAFT_2293791 [Mycena galericulata]|nr:hypothetical protein B0H11DRAFT_2293791 [Mycena galericulata]
MPLNPHQMLRIEGSTFNDVAGDLNIHSTTVLSSSGSSRCDEVGTRSTRQQRSYPYPKSRPRLSGSGHEDDHSGDVVSPLLNLNTSDRSGVNGRDDSAHGHNIGSNISATHGTYTAIAGNLNVTSYGENGLDILHRSICADAVHNSAARPPNPSCHPGTRNQILEKLDNWRRDRRQEGTLLWLHGTAGAGKSAVAQTFAWSCQDQGLLGGSFFFLRRDPDRGTWRKLFPTLAYQLAAAFPELNPLIQRAVETDKLVVTQTILQQFQKLITAPLEQVPMLAFPPILVIDGLDECENHWVQTTLLQNIIKALRTRRISLRVLIASRSEPHIREVLQATENFGQR